MSLKLLSNLYSLSEEKIKNFIDININNILLLDEKYLTPQILDYTFTCALKSYRKNIRIPNEVLDTISDGFRCLKVFPEAWFNNNNVEEIMNIDFRNIRFIPFNYQFQYKNELSDFVEYHKSEERYTYYNEIVDIYIKILYHNDIEKVLESYIGEPDNSQTRAKIFSDLRKCIPRIISMDLNIGD